MENKAFDLRDEVRSSLLEGLEEQKEQRLRLEIRETDWDECRSLDVLFLTDTSFTHVGDSGEVTIPTTSVKVFRNEAIEPDVERYYREYGMSKYAVEVCRVTEEDCRIAGIDPETGIDG